MRGGHPIGIDVALGWAWFIPSLRRSIGHLQARSAVMRLPHAQVQCLAGQ
jgi:hypothetical protein